jgi:multicomponent Na+:H+ antiporter subunit D
VEAQTKSRDLSALGGLANNMPVTGTTSAIAALSTAGIPPLSGFWSKLLIILALWGSGLYFYAVIAVLASLLTLAYFLLLQRMVFFGQVEEKLKNVTEARAGLLLPAVVLSVIIVAVGMGFPFLLPWFIAR